ncbi:hypothetical protein LJC37_02360 [Bacteroidales bacterium OttesenSCG-928-E04]|nr:hypothetical protein [Bacteroidales bacterium OttesenSCG-928-E04]
MRKNMTTLDTLKNNLIDKILVSRNENLLKAISTIFESTQEDDKIQLTSDQIEMLILSENDIEYGRIISEEELEKSDKEWR